MIATSEETVLEITEWRIPGQKSPSGSTSGRLTRSQLPGRLQSSEQRWTRIEMGSRYIEAAFESSTLIVVHRYEGPRELLLIAFDEFSKKLSASSPAGR
jgi:hypothetical protein